MEKFFELLKQHKFAEALMNDQDFVDGAKKMFKEEKIELSNEKLKELLDKTEERLNSMPELSEAALENISGTGAGATAVHAVTTVTGTLFGALLGGVSGCPGGAVVGANGADLLGRGDPNKAANVGAAVGTIAGAAGGAVTGGYLGHRFGRWICKKTGLE